MAYRPEAGSLDPRYPAFKMPSGHIVPGFGVKEAALMGAIVAAGISLVLLLGIPKVEVMAPVPDSERSALVDQMRYDRNYLYSLNAKSAALGEGEEGAGRYIYADKASEEEVTARAAAEGVSASTTDAEIEALVPTERAEERDLFGIFPRVALFVVLPVGLYFGLTFQFAQGTSLRGEFARYKRSRSRQKRYPYENPYLKEE